mmetsp:Transcript_14139/g.28850  ORF Transcript_14139/g.28850 Transcript_14139/m.28850 type:complete len:243 (+) Transcript_14139:39-767(+)
MINIVVHKHTHAKKTNNIDLLHHSLHQEPGRSDWCTRRLKTRFIGIVEPPNNNTCDTSSNGKDDGSDERTIAEVRYSRHCTAAYGANDQRYNEKRSTAQSTEEWKSRQKCSENAKEHHPASNQQNPAQYTQHLGNRFLVLLGHHDHFLEVVPPSANHPNHTKIISDLSTTFLINDFLLVDTILVFWYSCLGISIEKYLLHNEGSVKAIGDVLKLDHNISISWLVTFFNGGQIAIAILSQLWK